MLKLDAVNQMLGGIGQTPVTTLVTEHPSVIAAIATLNRVDKKIQTGVDGIQFWFNTDRNLTLSYNPITDEVILPSTTLNVDTVDTTLPYVQRGSRLYDQVQSTFEIGADVIVKLVQLLDFEDLPEVAGSAIASAATYEFVMDLQGDQNKLARLEDLMNKTMIALKAKNILNNNTNVSTNPTVQRILGGIRPRR